MCAEENVSESYCNLKYYDNCAYVYPEESDKILMHDGCPMFFSYYSSQNIEGIKKYCSAVLKINNYSSNENSCINLCLNKIKDLYQNQYPSTRCGMSGRLILFIGKVVKWMKYLVPVIVIVLSIIDFIKATGADKEDEIKKAQNKFIRRLIIAALIFIMPFIIEFVLNKMGFDASGCGIIDL